MILEEKIINEEELVEKIPKDLANAYKNGSRNTSRELDKSGQNSWGPGRINHERQYGGPTVDFENSSYEKITPDKAFELYKAGNKNIRCVFDGQLANMYLDDAGAKRYDWKAVLRSNETPFTNSKGVVKNDSAQLTPRDFFNNADSIYLVDEVPIDPNLRAEREKNPESRAHNTLSIKPIPKPVEKSISRANTYDIDISGDTARYNSSYIDGFEYQGKELDRTQYYDLPVWVAVRDKFLSRWGSNDRDTQSAEYIVRKLSGGGTSPEDLDWKAHDRAQNDKAAIRYKDSKDALTATSDELKDLANQASEVKKSLEKEKSSLEKFSTPEAKDRRKMYISQNLDYYKSRLRDIMREIAKIEIALDNLDDDDAAQIDKFNSNIADLENQLVDISNKIKSASTNKSGGNKPNIPGKVGRNESLEEDLGTVEMPSTNPVIDFIQQCWTNIQQLEMQTIDGSLVAVRDDLIDSLYIAIGQAEKCLAADQAPVEEVEVVTPEIIEEPVAKEIPVVKVITDDNIIKPEEMARAGSWLTENDRLYEDIDFSESLEEDKPEFQQDQEEEVKDDIRAVDDIREDNVELSLNPEEVTNEDDLDANFVESIDFTKDED